MKRVTYETKANKDNNTMKGKTNNKNIKVIRVKKVQENQLTRNKVPKQQFNYKE